MHPPGKETRPIVDDELVRIFRHLEHLEAEGLENYVIALAIHLQFEFAARRSEFRPLERDWVDLEKRRAVWPDSKTGGISKPMSEDAYRLLSSASRRDPRRCPANLLGCSPTLALELAPDGVPPARVGRGAQEDHQVHY